MADPRRQAGARLALARSRHNPVAEKAALSELAFHQAEIPLKKALPHLTEEHRQVLRSLLDEDGGE